MTRLRILRPDDWHLHVRDGTQLASVLPFTARQFARAAHRICTVYGDEPIDTRLRNHFLCNRRNEIRRPALHHVRAKQGMTAIGRAVVVARLRNAAGKHRGIVRLAHHDFGVGTFLLQYARYASQRARCTEPRHPVIQREILEIA